LLLRTAIGVGTTPFSCVFRKSEHYSGDGADIFQQLSPNAEEASFALNQGTPQKGADYIIFPAVSRS
jgi:hypothetical protein